MFAGRATEDVGLTEHHAAPALQNDPFGDGILLRERREVLNVHVERGVADLGTVRRADGGNHDGIDQCGDRAPVHDSHGLLEFGLEGQDHAAVPDPHGLDLETHQGGEIDAFPFSEAGPPGGGIGGQFLEVLFGVFHVNTVSRRPRAGQNAPVERIRRGRVLLADLGLVPATVTIDEGRIVSIDAERSGTPASGADVDAILVPAFVDLQVNGLEDVDVWASALDADDDAWDRLDDLLIDRGVGTWCPTLVTARVDDYPTAMSHLMRRTPSERRPRIAGVHLEGPFLGSAPGAHRRDLVTRPTIEFFDGLPEVPLIVTMGVEDELATDTIRELVRRGIIVSMGHTRPDRPCYEAAVDAGVRMATHVHNAMSGMAHRDPGLATWVLNDDRVIAGLIADGVHVHPDIVRLTFRCKPDGVALVTDSVATRRGTAGPVTLNVVDGAPRLPDGTLAGSATTMSESLRTCRNAGVPLDLALRAATATPAAAIGRDDIGVIRVGARADLVELNDSLDVTSVWLGGHRLR